MDFLKKSKVLSGLSESLKDYFHVDYFSREEQKTETEVPVPDRLLPKSKYRQIVNSLKLSQKIGILLWLEEVDSLSIGGRERLYYLQEKASLEAISAGVNFALRLSKEPKLISDFKHAARELNRRPQSKRFRTTYSRRIGVGYRDKGTLPDLSALARKRAHEDSFVSVYSVPEKLLETLVFLVPSALTEDEEWLDLSELRIFGSEEKEKVQSFLTPL